MASTTHHRIAAETDDRFARLSDWFATLFLLAAVAAVGAAATAVAVAWPKAIGVAALGVVVFLAFVAPLLAERGVAAGVVRTEPTDSPTPDPIGFVREERPAVAIPLTRQQQIQLERWIGRKLAAGKGGEHGAGLDPADAARDLGFAVTPGQLEAARFVAWTRLRRSAASLARRISRN